MRIALRTEPIEIENPNKIREVKREIARIKTLLNERSRA